MKVYVRSACHLHKIKISMLVNFSSWLQWTYIYVRSMLVPPSSDQQSAKHSSWPFGLEANLDELQNPYRPWFWSFGQVGGGHEDGMKQTCSHARFRKMCGNKQTNKQKNKQTNKDPEILLQRSFLHQSAFHPMSFLKPNLHLVTTVQCLDFANFGQPRHHQEHSSRCNFPAAFMLATIYREDWRSMFRSAFHLHKLEISMLVNLEKLAAINLYLCYRFLFPWRQGYVRSMSMLVPPSWDHKI